jgi:hypothetical protein
MFYRKSSSKSLSLFDISGSHAGKGVDVDSDLWRRVALSVATNVSEELSASNFKLEVKM